VSKETICHSSTLFDEEGDISAGKLYTFQAAKTYSRSPLIKSVISKIKVDSPKRTEVLEAVKEEVTPSTPYSLRKRVINDIKKIQKILENSEDEGDDFSDSGSEFSGESSESENESSPEKVKSSGRTLDGLATPRLTKEVVNEIFKGLDINETHKKQLTNLVRTQIACFEKWDFLLRQNKNILLYGIGSKKEIIEKYLGRFSKTHPVISVNGYFPSVSASDVIDQLCECLKVDSGRTDSLDLVEGKLSNYEVVVYIGINNIDGGMIRSKKSQGVLARIARLPQIRMVASIDHINSPLLWDQCLLTDFNWIWMDSTTFLPYSEETSFEGSILMQSSGQLTLASLRSVFNSLTKNARALFLILCREQSTAEKGWEGMTFQELYREGRRHLLLSSDSALRLQLKEFIDHAVVKQKRSAGDERYRISMDNAILKQFLEEQGAST